MRPFVQGNGVVARAVERALLQATGLDPTGVAVPEVGHLRGGLAPYVGALAAYATGTVDGVALWLRHCCRGGGRRCRGGYAGVRGGSGGTALLTVVGPAWRRLTIALPCAERSGGSRVGRVQQRDNSRPPSGDRAPTRGSPLNGQLVIGFIPRRQPLNARSGHPSRQTVVMAPHLRELRCHHFVRPGSGPGPGVVRPCPQGRGRFVPVVHRRGAGSWWGAVRRSRLRAGPTGGPVAGGRGGATRCSWSWGRPAGSGASVLATAVAVRAARAGVDVVLVDGCPLGGGLDVVLGAEQESGIRWAGPLPAGRFRRRAGPCWRGCRAPTASGCCRSAGTRPSRVPRWPTRWCRRWPRRAPWSSSTRARPEVPSRPPPWRRPTGCSSSRGTG